MQLCGGNFMIAEQLNANQSKYAGFLRAPDRDLWSAVFRAVDRISAWCTNARSRHALRQLSDHTLKDIGLTRCDVYRECGKPFWRE
jgi:uncharacterized protein YjiS (DUF1127 family)